MGEAIGQDVEGGTAAGVGRQRRADRPVYTEALRRLREAEHARTSAMWDLELATTRLLRGEAGEAEIEEVERELDAAERQVRRYTAAVRALKSGAGVIRDPHGNVLNR